MLAWHVPPQPLAAPYNRAPTALIGTDFDAIKVMELISMPGNAALLSRRFVCYFVTVNRPPTID
jgi:hypothetical protein